MVKNNNGSFNWLLVFIWFGIIFFLSSIPGQSLPKMPSDLWHFWAHRIAHIGEYSILGVLLIRAYSYKKNRLELITVLFLSFFVFLSGSFDEWHQSFVAGRTSQFIDVVFDTICGFLGMHIYFLWFKLKHKNPPQK